MKTAVLLCITLLAVAGCKPKPQAWVPPPPPPPKPQGTLKVGDYYCYTAGGVVLANQGFRVPTAGRYQASDGRGRGTFVIEQDNVLFTGGHFDKSTGRNLKADTFRIGTGIECAPKP
jgi:hypothetical protein